MRVFLHILSLAFDLIFFLILAFIIAGIAGNESAFLPIILASGGLVVPLCFLRRSRLSQRRHWQIPIISSIGNAIVLPRIKRMWSSQRTDSDSTRTCSYCHRTISADAKYCRFCLTTVGEVPLQHEPEKFSASL